MWAFTLTLLAVQCSQANGPLLAVYVSKRSQIRNCQRKYSTEIATSRRDTNSGLWSDSVPCVLYRNLKSGTPILSHQYRSHGDLGLFACWNPARTGPWGISPVSMLWDKMHFCEAVCSDRHQGWCRMCRMLGSLVALSDWGAWKQLTSTQQRATELAESISCWMLLPSSKT